MPGLVFSSPSAQYRRFSSRESFDTRLFGSVRSPNTIASLGQDWAHAVWMSPSLSGRFSSRALPLPSRMRCTQNVHFSITPLERTVTSGLSCQFRGSGNASVSGRVGSAYSNQLNERTLYGQLLEQ